MNESSYLSYPQLILLLLLRLCLLLGHPDPLEVVPRGGVEELLAHVVVEALPHLETLSDTFFSRNENVKVVVDHEFADGTAEKDGNWDLGSLS